MIDAQHIARTSLGIVGQMHPLRRPKFVPEEADLASIITEAFWASLAQYEGVPLQFRLFFVPRIGDLSVVQLGAPTPLSRHEIRALSPAHAASGGLLVAAEGGAGLWIHALLSSSPHVRGAMPLWLSVESRGPGLISVCIGSKPIVEFTRGVLKQVAGMSLDRTWAEVLLMDAGLFPEGQDALGWKIASMLLDAGRAIERWGTGGSIWVLQSGKSMNQTLRDSGRVVEFDFDLFAPFREMWEMRTLMIDMLNSPDRPSKQWIRDPNRLQFAAQDWDFLRQDAVLRTVSSLANVDGAIVMNGDPQLLGFGVICNKFDCPAKSLLRATNASVLTEGEPVTASAFGGSRHRSSIDFCSSFSPAAAIVASHDGGVTVFASKEKGSVIGSRVSLIESDAEVGSAARSTDEPPEGQ